MRRPSLGPNEIRLWHAHEDIFADPRWLRAAEKVLDESERRRAASFRRDEDRRRFVAARGRLRWLLSACTGSPPERIAFGSEAYGKPFLMYPDAAIQFNVSHADQFIVWGLTKGFPVGVDVERASSAPIDARVVRDHFHIATRKDIESAGHQGFAYRFLEHWVLTEAFVKGVGRGLGARLDEFRFRFEGADRSAVHFEHPRADEAARWSFWLFQMDDIYRIAIAAGVPGGHLVIAAAPGGARGEGLRCLACTPGSRWSYAPRRALTVAKSAA